MTDSRNEPPKEAARYGAPAYYVDSESPEIEQFVVRALSDLPDDASQTSKAIRLFDAVRDGIRYDPYTFALDTDAYRASRIAKSDSAFCVPKAILLAACLRDYAQVLRTMGKDDEASSAELKASRVVATVQ